MSPRTEKQFEEIRIEKSKLILDTALPLFANNGYHSTSISQIAKNAGISKGLIYNYFKSKEDLVQSIFQTIVDKFTLSNIASENTEYTIKEAEDFFDNFFAMLIENPKEWKLFYQLSFQTDVMEILMKNLKNHAYDDTQKIILKYFTAQHFQDPEVSILLFSSIIKGFTLQYAFAPELFSKDLLDRFKAKFKTLFINSQIEYKNGKDIDFDESLSYFLL